MTDRELMQQALEALEHEAQKGNDDAYRVERDALRAAIEHHTPVAWYHPGSSRVRFENPNSLLWIPLYK